MDRRKASITTALFCMLSFLNAIASSSASDMGDFTVDLAIATTPLHEWMPSISYNPIENEFLVLWHTTGVREAGGQSMYSVHAQRISPDGRLLGDPFTPIESYGPERGILPRAAHNSFTNEYMVSLAKGQELTEWDPFITLLAHDGTPLYGPVPLSEEPSKSNHVSIVFNPLRRQYFITYNDSRNGVANVYGVIVPFELARSIRESGRELLADAACQHQSSEFVAEHGHARVLEIAPGREDEFTEIGDDAGTITADRGDGKPLAFQHISIVSVRHVC